MSETDDIKAVLRKKRIKRTIPVKDLLGSGATLLNLACSGDWRGAFAKGFYYFLVGSSDSGKTFLTMTCFAEAQINKEFKNYDLIYWGSERGALMDIESFFGKAVAKKLQTRYPDTIEQFYYNVLDQCKKGPFIGVLDSMDGLSSSTEEKQVKARKKAVQEGEQAKGMMSDGKAKVNSANLRKVISELDKSGSILIVISQERDAIGQMFKTKTHSGGRSLKFYSTIQLWTSRVGTITRKYRDKTRKLGIYSEIECKRNRITGKEHTVEIPIYNTYGIDDLGSCIDYLLDEKYWKLADGKITADGIADDPMKREQLIRYIEEEGLEDELRAIVAECWDEIQQALTVERKSRYE